jgi:hypothetical protein
MVQKLEMMLAVPTVVHLARKLAGATVVLMAVWMVVVMVA